MDGDAVPTVATVIPVLNEALFIERCLMSLLNQSLAPSRHMILVLDGGSNDGTVEIVHRIMTEHQGEQWPRLVLEKNPQRTVAHARNIALKVLPGPSSSVQIARLVWTTVRSRMLRRKHVCPSGHDALAVLGLRLR